MFSGGSKGSIGKNKINQIYKNLTVVCYILIFQLELPKCTVTTARNTDQKILKVGLFRLFKKKIIFALMIALQKR